MLYLLIAALGIGPLFQLPLLHLQAAMPVRDLATSTATLALLRSVGGTVGIAVAGAVYASKLRTGLEGIEGWDAYAQANGRSASSAAGAVEGLTDIEVRHDAARTLARARLTSPCPTSDSRPSCAGRSCTSTPARSTFPGSSRASPRRRLRGVTVCQALLDAAGNGAGAQGGQEEDERREGARGDRVGRTAEGRRGERLDSGVEADGSVVGPRFGRVHSIASLTQWREEKGATVRIGVECRRRRSNRIERVKGEGRKAKLQRGQNV